MDKQRTIHMSIYSPSIGWYGMEYKFIKDDAGRSQSKRPKQSNDCTVRAVAKAGGFEYDMVYDLFMQSGRKSGRGFDLKTWAKKGHIKGHKLVWTPLQAIKGQPRMNIAAFAETHETGTYILRVSKHVFAMIDGVVYDTGESRPDKCVYGYWQIKPAMP